VNAALRYRATGHGPVAVLALGPRRAPKLPEDERRDVVVHVRMTRDERAQLEAAAPGRQFSEWARGALLRAAKRALAATKRKRAGKS